MLSVDVDSRWNTYAFNKYYIYDCRRWCQERETQRILYRDCTVVSTSDHLHTHICLFSPGCPAQLCSLIPHALIECRPATNVVHQRVYHFSLKRSFNFAPSSLSTSLNTFFVSGFSTLRLTGHPSPLASSPLVSFLNPSVFRSSKMSLTLARIGASSRRVKGGGIMFVLS